MRLMTVLAAAGLCLALSSCAPTPQLTDDQLDEIMSLRETQLIELGTAMGVYPGQEIPELVQWLPDDDEGRDLWIACIDGDDSNQRTWECTAKYTHDPRLAEPLTKEQFSTLFHYLTTELQPCLEQRGITVDPAPKSLNSFINADRLGTPWTPYNSVKAEQLETGEWSKLNQECPAQPPFTELYGPPLPQL